MDLTKVFHSELVTEKTELLRNATKPIYTFIVEKKASKRIIAIAFKTLFGVLPARVNTLLRKPKPTRHTKTKRRGMTKLVKITYISLPKGVRLDLGAEQSQDDNKE